MTIERLAEGVWRKKVHAEEAEADFRESQAVLIDEMQEAEVKTVIVVLDTTTDVTGTLVESERMVVDEEAIRRCGPTIYNRVYPETVIPRQVIPESRSRHLDEDALRQVIAEGKITTAAARKGITYEASRKPFVKWTVKTTNTGGPKKKGPAGLKNTAGKPPKAKRA